jgi:hypothetical protein
MSDLHFEWNNDGHQIKLVIDKADLLVSMAFCPNGRKAETDCWNERADGCIVDYYVDRYGLEINVGKVIAAPLLSVAWAFHGDKYNLDSAQVWIIPTADEAFSAWLEERTSPSEQDNTEKGTRQD